jgi:hypothetical protein
MRLCRNLLQTQPLIEQTTSQLVVLPLRELIRKLNCTACANQSFPPNRINPYTARQITKSIRLPNPEEILGAEAPAEGEEPAKNSRSRYPEEWLLYIRSIA